MTDPDPVELAMHEIQRTSTEPGTPNPLSPDPAGNLVREVILGPENSIAKAPAEPDPESDCTAGPRRSSRDAIAATKNHSRA